MIGRFVVLEGGDGCGKSTQVGLLGDRLRGHGFGVVETREPGGTTLGDAIRALLLDGDSVAPVAEALLMAADRAQHVGEMVRPALESGAWVVADRYVPSSLVYQGLVRGLGIDEVERVNAWATGGLEPDLVVVLDVDDVVAEGRRAPQADRMEREGDGFHAEVRAAYRRLAAERGWRVVDGTGAVDVVSDAVFAVVAPLLGASGATDV